VHGKLVNASLCNAVGEAFYFVGLLEFGFGGRT
jgi:hypothetical protein